MSAIVAALICAGIFIAFSKGAMKVSGAVISPAGVTNLTDLQVAGTVSAGVAQCLGGPCNAANYSQEVTLVACNGTAGTSTLFAYQSPFGATSTAAFESLEGTGNATTTSLIVGTSSQAVGLTSSNVTPIFVNASVSTSSPFYFVPGYLGIQSSGSATAHVIVVGPNQYVAGEATTTAVGAGATSFGAPYTGCVGIIRWAR